MTRTTGAACPTGSGPPTGPTVRPRPRRRHGPRPAPLMRLAICALRATTGSAGRGPRTTCMLDGWSLGQVFADVCAAVRGAARRSPGVPVRRPFRGLPALAGRAGRGAGRDALAGGARRVRPRRRRCPSTGAARRHTAPESGRSRRTSSLSGGASGGCGECRAAQRADREHVVQGAWALLLSRYGGERRRGVRHHRLRAAGRPARRRGHDRHVHQHGARPGSGCAAGAGRCLAAAAAGRAGRGAPLRLRVAGAAPGLQRRAGRAATCSTAWWRSRTTRSTRTRAEAGLRVREVDGRGTPPTSRCLLRAYVDGRLRLRPGLRPGPVRRRPPRAAMADRLARRC